jgi:hypothetical protein
VNSLCYEALIMVDPQGSLLNCLTSQWSAVGQAALVHASTPVRQCVVTVDKAGTVPSI